MHILAKHFKQNPTETFGLIAISFFEKSKSQKSCGFKARIVCSHTWNIIDAQLHSQQPFIQWIRFQGVSVCLSNETDSHSQKMTSSKSAKSSLLIKMVGPGVFGIICSVANHQMQIVRNSIVAFVLHIISSPYTLEQKKTKTSNKAANQKNNKILNSYWRNVGDPLAMKCS